ncbi:MAG TPA: thiamine pyrophosphate-dependent dehydrogenase E1 component subunit alpha [Elusimicrobiales bacterium]|nr:thiamine pyrophosphate-dependent dehydrogenase E1 component subunit alpha [Elusimicrobiales bacterium]
MLRVDKKTKIELLRLMAQSRLFEEKIVSVYGRQDMKTPVHLYIGQEAVAAGVCAQLRREDYIFSTHRNHGHYLSKGADMPGLVAELYGRQTGCSKGKGGSMHFVDVSCGCMGTSSIVGGAIPLAVGAALAAKVKKEDRISVAFFGDGAADEGVFQESLNFAALHKLPVVFVCENNYYATNSHQSARHARETIAKRGQAFGLPGSRHDGNNVEAVYIAARKAVNRARRGLGPSLLEFTTYRWKGHVGPDCDHEKGCRPKPELESWQRHCPIEAYKKILLKEQILDQAGIAALNDKISETIESAWKKALAAPYPGPEELYKDVYR